MCGFSGLVDFSGRYDSNWIKKSIDLLRHRGPDDEGIERIVNSEYTVWLGFRRLAIIDLTQAGHQPMFSADRRVAIVFNGEVYNYRQLRNELIERGYTFRSNSDTEVILCLYQEFGISFVNKLNGMFAIALCDFSKHKLYLIRDRIGVKPLYYKLSTSGNILFASELKALLALEKTDQKISHSAVFQYFTTGYIPSPNSIFDGISKLSPGHYAEYELMSKHIRLERYWEITPGQRQFESLKSAALELEELMRDAFSLRMIADVPVGIFLSGGYDSTCVTAILQSMSSNRLKTFTIGFNEADYNEAPFARRVAQHIGTEHHELLCTKEQALDIIPELAYYYDEPFGDSSAIPTMLVSRLAKSHVTVSLSADGGDELFAGYQRHLKGLQQIGLLSKIPSGIRTSVLSILKAIPRQKDVMKHDLISKLANYLRYEKVPLLFLNQLSIFSPYQIQSLLREPATIMPLQEFHVMTDRLDSVLKQILLTDLTTYLPDDILTKVDRATMAVSLEGREPLLDYRLVEFAFQLPDEFKIDKSGMQKAILKHIVHQYVPREIMERPKMGFGIPIHRWLQKDLSWMLQEIFSEEKIKKQGFFNHKTISQAIQSFLKYGENTDFQRIWLLLMFQMWFDRWVDAQS
ncbi:asparagine synthase (glutamine-hydrolyzing) [Schleiferia thermophila]|uniref:asparagine synthase (glutamine-hydrolyzing) n=1 Tax=Schleiferia thermophila TaxID=884107 RepID=UPI003EF04936